MSISEQANALCARGQIEAGSRLLHQAANAGDAGALFTLALWRVSGSLIQRDLPLSRRLLAGAAQAGEAMAALFYAYFLANGTGGQPEWPMAIEILRRLSKHDPACAEQLALLSGMALNSDGAPALIPAGKILNEAPHVVLFANFLSPAEAAYVQKTSTQRLQPSTIVDPATGKLIQHPIRRSDDSMFGVFDEDLVINAINRRIAAVSATTPDQGEPLIVLRYQHGGEYRAHSDALSGTDNQRIATVILYLNVDYRGGETRFVETGLTVRGRIGDALLFRNVTADGRPDPLSRHAGLPIEQGTKWIATRWIRARTYTYPAPRPALG